MSFLILKPLAEIIEIAALKISNKSTEIFHQLIKIEGIIPINITALTGITNEMVYNALPISEILPKFLEFIGNYPLIGHNIKAFDFYFLKDACAKQNYSIPQNQLIDTYLLAKNKLHGLEKYNLTSLCNYYGIDCSNAHRALRDCEMCNAIYQMLIADNNETYLSLSMSKNTFDQQLLLILNAIITEKELPENSLRIHINPNKTIKSLSILINEPPFPLGSERRGGEQSIMKIGIKKNIYTVDILESVFESIPIPADTQYERIKKTGTNPQHIGITFMAADTTFYEYVKTAVLHSVSHYETSEPAFSCCSQFIKCSDEKKCVHANKLYSTACVYRHNLENGKIFYGKNRNID